jgi:hypothetical protein
VDAGVPGGGGGKLGFRLLGTDYRSLRSRRNLNLRCSHRPGAGERTIAFLSRVHGYVTPSDESYVLTDDRHEREHAARRDYE